ncbi:class I SAM-dependent methyltransferase [Terricaulis sp.]|uniref:class I SAM-dependent methyltransferase n=1 Tax=Terricaulis sp. TaxID=2768686 RepID=UPI00378328CC
MNLYDRFVLPTLINAACGCAPIARQRQKVVPLARGVVLELGFGSGLNLSHYDAFKVQKLYALEPEEGMLKLARRAVRTAPFEVELLTETAERASLPAESVDTVLVTYALCTIPDAVTALRAARAALKPDGRLIFCEHGLAPDEGVRRWQRRIEPVWRRIAGGCHLARDIPAMIKSAGFALESLDTMYLPRAPKWAGYNYWGAARAV